MSFSLCSTVVGLDKDLRKHAREWLADFVNERAGVEFTRSDVLTQIDRVEARLRARIAAAPTAKDDDDEDND